MENPKNDLYQKNLLLTIRRNKNLDGEDQEGI
jgi:hypothetical protein